MNIPLKLTGLALALAVTLNSVPALADGAPMRPIALPVTKSVEGAL